MDISVFEHKYGPYGHIYISKAQTKKKSTAQSALLVQIVLDDLHWEKSKHVMSSILNVQ